MDQRVGVLGELEDAGKKALFLRTYTRDIFLFPTDDPPNEKLDALIAAGVTVVRRSRRVEKIGNKVSVAAAGGAPVDPRCVVSGARLHGAVRARHFAWRSMR